MEKKRETKDYCGFRNAAVIQNMYFYVSYGTILCYTKTDDSCAAAVYFLLSICVQKIKVFFLTAYLKFMLM